MTPIENDDFDILEFDEVFNDRFGQKQETSMAQGIAESGAMGPFGRHVMRSGARIGETMAGMPGDIRDVSSMAVEWLGDSARAALGKEPLDDEQRSYVNDVKNAGLFGILGKFADSLPTASDIRESVTKRFTGDYLEPQNEGERVADEVVSDFATLALPVKGKIPFARALGQSVLANSGAEVAGAFLGDEGKQYTKAGLLFTMGMLPTKGNGLKNYMSSLYKDMESTIPKGAEINASALSKSLKNIESELLKGDPTALSKKIPMEKIQAIRSKINSGMIDVDEVLALTRDTNESIFGLSSLKRGQNKLYDIREALHKTARQYGAENPEFLGKWRDANQAYAATETSRKAGNWIRKNFKPRDYIHAATALGLEGVVLGAPATAATMGAAGAIGATAYAAEVMKRISQSPALRRYYQNAVTSSLKQNSAAFSRAAKQLDKGLEQSFKEEPYETVEFD